MSRTLEIATSLSGSNWIINTESHQTVLFKDVELNMDDVWNAVQKCDGICLDDEEDRVHFMQTVLDVASEKSDSR